MADNDDVYREKVSRAFEIDLNSSGYGFQYSVLKLAKELYEQRKSKWLFEVAEFPVEVQGRGTRIDFILKLSTDPPFYLLAECKRANPAFSNWCFARAPFVRRNRTHEPLIIEHARCNDMGDVQSCGIGKSALPTAYHVALVVKSDEKGDMRGKGQEMIEEGATQICRGLNGKIEFFSKNWNLLGRGGSATFLPVIFTTANIWTTNIDLCLATIETGEIDVPPLTMEKKAWIAYQYHMSPGLKHSSSRSIPENLRDAMDVEYIRTIPIVNALGIEEFLRWSSYINEW